MSYPHSLGLLSWHCVPFLLAFLLKQKPVTTNFDWNMVDYFMNTVDCSCCPWTDLELWAGIWTMKSHMDPLNVIGWVGGSVALGSGPKSICPFPFVLWLLRVLPGALIRASLHLLISNAFHFEYMFMCDRLRGHYKTNILILDSTICFLDEAQYLSILHYVKYPNFYSAHYAGTISSFCTILSLSSAILQILHNLCLTL